MHCMLYLGRRFVEPASFIILHALLELVVLSNQLCTAEPEKDLSRQVIQHGACLGLGLAALGTNDEELFEDMKGILYMDSAVAGEAAGLSLGLLCVGSASEKATELLAYAHETQHEKVGGTRIMACTWPQFLVPSVFLPTLFSPSHMKVSHHPNWRGLLQVGCEDPVGHYPPRTHALLGSGVAFFSLPENYLPVASFGGLHVVPKPP
jgi:hypothetical protein